MTQAPNSYFTPSVSSETLSPTLLDGTPAVCVHGSNELLQPLQTSRGLTDEAREVAIVYAGKAVERYMADWEAHGCFAAKGDADRARRLMELLIAGRSAEQVARMAAAQAERMAQEPGAERLA